MDKIASNDYYWSMKENLPSHYSEEYKKKQEWREKEEIRIGQTEQHPVVDTGPLELKEPKALGLEDWDNNNQEEEEPLHQQERGASRVPLKNVDADLKHEGDYAFTKRRGNIESGKVIEEVLKEDHKKPGEDIPSAADRFRKIADASKEEVRNE